MRKSKVVYFTKRELLRLFFCLKMSCDLFDVYVDDLVSFNIIYLEVKELEEIVLEMAKRLKKRLEGAKWQNITET